ncbi:transcription factor-like protein DPB isoform X2 [Rhododendron vialii]|uniref:transcription factor-like protein DPB isoform X2 n=1 Tax=Rhododendron vialii TaxID=182163 RepID=UPI0026602A79|nr:transcription factor-like protein DPB isoform X2 [Rhododendron vialii]
MVSGGSNPQHDGVSRGGGGGAITTTRSWGTTVSGQSVSTSGSVGSPSSSAAMATPSGEAAAAMAAAAAAATPDSEKTALRLNHLDIQGDEAGSQAAAAGKKKRGQRAVGADKSGRGLRQFSMKVCEKVESKGRTTYNEVADELVAEFAEPSNSLTSPDKQQYDEKNIRRRVYDALNVLMAMDIISKDKKEIQWRGLPQTSLSDIEELKAERLGLGNRIGKKAAYLQELEEQFVGLQNLIHRNEQLYSSGNSPSGGVALPFILVQTRPHATVEVEISEDMQLVHFDFNSTPFELHDDNYVLKAMKFCERPQGDVAAPNSSADGGEGSSMSNMFQPHISHPSRSNNPDRPLNSPPLPGILKARVKHEH